MNHRRLKTFKLLIIIIVEFFICWTPLYTYHTCGAFDKKFYRAVPAIFVDLILLFSFASLLCNPLTYYFMSKRYRAMLYAYLSSCCRKKDECVLKKKNLKARQIIEALRLHKRENFREYKSKSNELHSLSFRFRSNTSGLRWNTIE